MCERYSILAGRLLFSILFLGWGAGVGLAQDFTAPLDGIRVEGEAELLKNEIFSNAADRAEFESYYLDDAIVTLIDAGGGQVGMLEFPGESLSGFWSSGDPRLENPSAMFRGSGPTALVAGMTPYACLFLVETLLSADEYAGREIESRQETPSGYTVALAQAIANAGTSSAFPYTNIYQIGVRDDGNVDSMRSMQINEADDGIYEFDILSYEMSDFGSLPRGLPRTVRTTLYDPSAENSGNVAAQLEATVSRVVDIPPGRTLEDIVNDLFSGMKYETPEVDFQRIKGLDLDPVMGETALETQSPGGDSSRFLGLRPVYWLGGLFVVLLLILFQVFRPRNQAA